MAPPHVKSPKQNLHEYYIRHHGKLDINLINSGTREVDEWTGVITCTGGKVLKTDTELPDNVFTATGRSKKAAEQAASTVGWKWLEDNGYLTPEAMEKSVVIRHNQNQPPKEKQLQTHPLVFLDVEIDGDPAGRIVIELFDDVVPKTAENFRQLCTGENAAAGSYKGSVFHRAAPRKLIQAGDITNGDGSGGRSIYNDGGVFDDENFTLRHERPFRVSCANMGPDTNASAFQITTAVLPLLNGVSVVFGQVLHGYGTVRELEYTPADDTYRPLARCVIVDCGQLPTDLDLSTLPVYTDAADGLPWWSDDFQIPDDAESEVAARIKAAQRFRQGGGAAFREGRLAYAVRKYTQGIRWVDWTRMRRLGALMGDDRMKLVKEENLCRCNRALCSLQLERFEEAVDDTRIILAEEPDCAKASLRLGRALGALRKPLDAIAVLRDAERLLRQTLHRLEGGGAAGSGGGGGGGAAAGEGDGDGGGPPGVAAAAAAAAAVAAAGPDTPAPEAAAATAAALASAAAPSETPVPAAAAAPLAALETGQGVEAGGECAAPAAASSASDAAAPLQPLCPSAQLAGDAAPELGLEVEPCSAEPLPETAAVPAALAEAPGELVSAMAEAESLEAVLAGVQHAQDAAASANAELQFEWPATPAAPAAPADEAVAESAAKGVPSAASAPTSAPSAAAACVDAAPKDPAEAAVKAAEAAATAAADAAAEAAKAAEAAEAKQAAEAVKAAQAAEAANAAEAALQAAKAAQDARAVQEATAAARSELVAILAELRRAEQQQRGVQQAERDMYARMLVPPKTRRRAGRSRSSSGGGNGGEGEQQEGEEEEDYYDYDDDEEEAEEEEEPPRRVTLLGVKVAGSAVGAGGAGVAT